MIYQVYTSIIRAVPVRFFPPQTDNELMPWVDADALLKAMTLNKAWQTTVAPFIKRMARCISTSTGRATIVPFSCARSVISAPIELGYLDATFLDEFTTQMFAAAQQIHPEMFEEDDHGWTINSSSIARLVGRPHQDLVDYIEEHLDEIGALGGVRRGP